MKWFISLPMNERSDEDVKKEMSVTQEIIKARLDKDAEFIDSFIEDAPDDAGGLYYLGKSLEIMDKADACFFCNGWQMARGCKIEYACACEYGKKLALVTPDGEFIQCNDKPYDVYYENRI